MGKHGGLQSMWISPSIARAQSVGNYPPIWLVLRISYTRVLVKPSQKLGATWNFCPKKCEMCSSVSKHGYLKWLWMGCPCSQPSVLGVSLRVRFTLRSMSLCFGPWHKRWNFLSTSFRPCICITTLEGDFHKTSLSACWEGIHPIPCACFSETSMGCILVVFSHPFSCGSLPPQNEKVEHVLPFFVLFLVGGKCTARKWLTLCPVLDPNPTISTLF